MVQRRKSPSRTNGKPYLRRSLSRLLHQQPTALPCLAALCRSEASRFTLSVAMEEPRKSLWARLVVFYSVNKRDQLNPQVRNERTANWRGIHTQLLHTRNTRRCSLSQDYGCPQGVQLPRSAGSDGKVGGSPGARKRPRALQRRKARARNSKSSSLSVLLLSGRAQVLHGRARAGVSTPSELTAGLLLPWLLGLFLCSDTYTHRLLLNHGTSFLLLLP